MYSENSDLTEDSSDASILRPGYLHPSNPDLIDNRLRPGSIAIDEILFEPQFKDIEKEEYDYYREQTVRIREITSQDTVVTVPTSVLELIPRDDSIENYWPRIEKSLKFWLRIKALKISWSQKKAKVLTAIKTLFGLVPWIRGLRKKATSKFAPLDLDELNSLARLPEEDPVKKPVDEQAYLEILTKIRDQYQGLADVVSQYDKYGLCLFRPGADDYWFQTPEIGNFLLFWSRHDRYGSHPDSSFPIGDFISYPRKKLELYDPTFYEFRKFELPLTYHLHNEIVEMHRKLGPWMQQLSGDLIAKLETWEVGPEISLLQVPDRIQKIIAILKSELERYQKELNYIETPEDLEKLREIREKIKTWRGPLLVGGVPFGDSFTDFERQQFPINQIAAFDQNWVGILRAHQSKIRVFFNSAKT